MKRFILIICIPILSIIITVQIVLVLKARHKERYITLNEVIPGARILSETDGIIEYDGKKFILGLDELNRKRDLINRLRLDTIAESVVIDMRFRRQIIVRKNVF